MNNPEIQPGAKELTCLSDGKALKLNGQVAIQSCSESAGESFLVRDDTLVVVTEGSFRIRYGTDFHTIGRNQMALLKKEILVSCSVNSETHRTDRIRFIMICFPPDLLKEFVRLAQLSVILPKQPSAVTIDAIDGRLLKFIDSLESYLNDFENIDEYLTRIKLLELLFNLVQTDSNVFSQLMDLRPHFRADITATVERSLMTPKSLNELAELSGRSLSSFKRDFLAIYNMPPSTWLRRRRLEKARELFLSTTMTVTDVCYTLGFENLAHFSRLFKSHFGYAPSKFRTATQLVA